jgi:hypothetical protein
LSGFDPGQERKPSNSNRLHLTWYNNISAWNNYTPLYYRPRHILFGVRQYVVLVSAMFVMSDSSLCDPLETPLKSREGFISLEEPGHKNRVDMEMSLGVVWHRDNPRPGAYICDGVPGTSFTSAE